MAYTIGAVSMTYWQRMGEWMMGGERPEDDDEQD
jgi:hypothetical protein